MTTRTAPSQPPGHLSGLGVWGAILLLLCLALPPGQALAQSTACDLRVTSDTAIIGGGGSPWIRMTFSFEYEPPSGVIEPCGPVNIRIPVSFPGGAPSQFVDNFWNQPFTAQPGNPTPVSYQGYDRLLPDFTPVYNGACVLLSDALECTNVLLYPANIPGNSNPGFDVPFQVRLVGRPIPNPSFQGCVAASVAYANGAPDPIPGENPHQSCYPVDWTAPPAANVYLSKLLDQDWAYAGDEVRFRLRVNNEGTVRFNFPIVDSFPAGFTYLGVTENPSVSCSATGGTVSCTHSGGGWPPGLTDFVLRFSTAGRPAGSYVNTCAAGGSPPSSDWNVLGPCSATVELRPRPSVIKTGPSSVDLGQTFNWILSVTGHFNGTTNSLTITDAVPAGIAILSATSPVGSCSTAGQTVTCNIGNYTGSGFDITLQVRADQAGSFTNQCQFTVGGSTAYDTNQCRHTVTVNAPLREIDLAITKVADRPTAIRGEPLNYTLTLTNLGPDDSVGPIIVTDLLPVGFVASSITSPSADYCNLVNATTAACQFTGHPVGEVRTIALQGTVAAGAPSSLTNRCRAELINSDESDPNPNNNGISACQVVTPVSDVGVTVTKTASAPQVYLGETFSYTLTVSNPHSAPAPNVVITDPLPAAVEFVSVSGTTPLSCSHAGGQPGVVTCSATSLAAGAAATVTINVRAIGEGNTVNTCTASVDGNAQVVPACTIGTQIVRGLVSVEKIDSADPVWLGQPFSYTLQVRNTSGGPAHSVTITDPLPPQVQPVSVTSIAPFSCALAGGQVTCTAATVPAGASVDIPISVIANAPGTANNVCSATVGGAPALGDCSESTVIQNGTVNVVKTDSADPVYVDQVFEYRLSVANTSPGRAQTVVISDPLPGGIVSAFAPTWQPPIDSCVVAGSTVTCTAASIEPGANALVTIPVRATEVGTPINACTATVGGASVAQPQCSEQTTVLDGGLSVVKSASANAVALGGEFTYFLTWQNSRPLPVFDAVIVDALPNEVELLSVTADAPFVCSTNRGGSLVLTCTAQNPVPGDASGSIAIHVRARSLSSSGDGRVENRCSASATGGEVDTTACVVNTLIEEVFPEVVKSDNISPAEVMITYPFTYRISFSNPSDLALPAHTIVDTLPTGLTYLSHTVSGAMSCVFDSGSRTLTCEVPEMSSGEQAFVDFEVRADAFRSFVNQCSVTRGDTPLVTPLCRQITNSRLPEINVAKSGPVSVVVGEQFTYILDWAYLSDLPVGPITIVDALPEGVGFLEVSSDSPLLSCSEANSVVTCTADELGPGDAGQILITVTAPAAHGQIINYCEGSAANEPIGVGDCSHQTTVRPDVIVDKTDAVDPVFVGQPVDYTIVLTNRGSEPVMMRMVDSLPVETEFVEVVPPAAWSCTPVVDDLECEGLMDGAGVASFQVRVTAPAEPSELLNTCLIQYEGIMPQDVSGGRGGWIDLPSEACNETTQVVDRQADLVAVKTGPAQVLVGEGFAYTLQVENLGPDDAVDVVVTDSLPEGVAFVAASGDGWACSHDGAAPGMVTCQRPALPVGTAPAITVEVGASDVAGTVVNTCTVSSATIDPVPNPLCSATTIIRELPVLAVAKVDLVDPVTVGQVITYVLTATNEDAELALSEVEVVDTLPPGTTFVSAQGDDWACAHDGQEPGVVSCQRSSLGPSQSATITLEVLAPEQAGIVLNQCSATATPSGAAAADACREETEVRGDADLVTSKRDLADPVLPGATINYEIEVTNVGQVSAATDVVVVDPLPAGTSFLAAAGDGWSCSHDGQAPGSVTCQRPSLAAGTSATIQLDVEAPGEAGVLVNTCSATMAEPDPTPGDPECLEETEVRGDADLVTNKRDLVDPVRPGAMIDYEIEVRNAGAATAATDVMVVDTLPVGTSFVAATGDGWTCAHDGQSPGAVTCQRPSLAAGATAVIALQVQAPEDPGVVVNVCSATMADPDPTPGDPGCQEETTVAATEATLDLSKTASPASVQVGGTVTWTIRVTNQGPDVAEAVVVTDAVPAELVVLEAVPSMGSCIVLDQAVTCQIGDLQADESAEVVLTTRAAAVGAWTNVCVVETAHGFAGNGSRCEGGVSVRPNVVVSKQVSAPVVEVYERFVYTIRLENRGPVAAQGVRVEDLMPSGLTVESMPAICTPDQGMIACEVGTLAAAPEGVMELAFTVYAASPLGQIRNVCIADLTGPDGDPIPADGVCEATNTVISGELPPPPPTGEPIRPVPVDHPLALLLMLLGIFSVGLVAHRRMG